LPGTIYDYFVRACRRPIAPESDRGIAGDPVEDSGGYYARFWIDAPAGRIQVVHYAATSCTTLLAVCEHIAELAAGADLTEISTVSVERLLGLHPDIPAEKRDSVPLAVKAFHAAAGRLH
jgi:hypothetical protein